MVSRDFSRQIEGYGLTTANILYRLPDYSGILQEYIWQDYDLAPLFPELKKFLSFWKRTLDGPLFKVTVAHKALIGEADLRLVSREFQLH